MDLHTTSTMKRQKINMEGIQENIFLLSLCIVTLIVKDCAAVAIKTTTAPKVVVEEAKFASLSTVFVRWTLVGKIGDMDSLEPDQHQYELRVVATSCNASVPVRQTAVPVAMQENMHMFWDLTSDRYLVCVRLAGMDLQSAWTTAMVQRHVDLPPTLPGMVSSEVIRAVSTPSHSVLPRPVLMHCPTEGSPRPRVQWFHNGTLLAPVNGSVERGKGKPRPVAGRAGLQLWSNGTLFIDECTAADMGPYHCEADNTAGRAKSDRVMLKQAVLADFPRDSRLETKRVPVGYHAELRCDHERNSVPAARTQWTRMADDYTDIYQSERTIITPTGTLVLTHVLDADLGAEYSCAIQNDVIAGSHHSEHVYEITEEEGNTSYGGRLLYAEADQTVMEGEDAELYCVFGGFPRPNVTWYVLPKATDWLTPEREILTDDRHEFKAANQILTIKHVTKDDQAQYKCLAIDWEANEMDHTTDLDVDEPPKYLRTVESVNVTEGGSATYHCRAEGRPSPTVTWYINGTLVSRRPDRVPVVKVSSSGEDMTIHDVRRGDSCAVQCYIANRHGMAISSGYLKVFVKTTVEKFPVDRVELSPGQRYLMPCLGQTDPSTSLTFTWMHNGQPVSSMKGAADSGLSLSRDGLLIKAGAEEAQIQRVLGEYNCTATNGLSTSEASFVVVRRPEPPTTAPPAWEGDSWTTDYPGTLPSQLENTQEKHFDPDSESPRVMESSHPSSRNHPFLYGIVGSLGAVILVSAVIATIVTKMRSKRPQSAPAYAMERLLQNPLADTRNATAPTYEDNGATAMVDENLKNRVKDSLIPREKLRLGKLIGKGQFGRVHLGHLVDDDKNVKKVAIKTLKYKSNETEMVEMFLKEALLMKDFSDRHVLCLLGIATDTDGSPLVILPYMENGDLRQYILNPELKVTVLELLKLGMQVAKGMVYLARMRFVHRDLAARNCMVDNEGVVKVADFGLSRDLFSRDYYRSDSGSVPLPIRWMAPESLDSNVFTTLTDVWSYGVLLWELMTRGATPYTDVENWQIPAFITGGKRLQQPMYCPDSIYVLMMKCWSEAPQTRPSFTELEAQVEEVIDSAATVNSGPENATSLYMNINSVQLTDYRNKSKSSGPSATVIGTTATTTTV